MTHKQTNVKHQTIEEFNKDNSISLSSPNSTDYFIPVQFGLVFARIYTPGQKHARNMSGQVAADIGKVITTVPLVASNINVR